MTSITITPLYAALLTFLFVTLSVRIIRLRRSQKIAIGDAGNKQMLRAMRVHSNFAEYVPLSLVMIFMVEAQSAHALLVHGLGLCLLAGRLSHAYGVSQTHEKFQFRITGMALTFTALVVAALHLVFTFTAKLVA